VKHHNQYFNIIYVVFILTTIFACCGKGATKPTSIETIPEPARQQSLYNSLLEISRSLVNSGELNDSLAFLILPVQASCPSCRKKTIDSIVARQHSLPARHYIIISGSAGRKELNSYFKEQEKELPIIPNHLLLDSTNQAYHHQLYTEKPTIYYAYDRKVYKKVSAIPATVKEDLREFFSNTRRNIKD
jgi:hypothetical protein